MREHKPDAKPTKTSAEQVHRNFKDTIDE